MRWVVLILCALAAGCNGSDGAVSVRWRIVDLTLGDVYDPKADSDAAGFCCPDAHIINRQCQFDSPWVIRSLAVTLADPSSGQVLKSQGFPCGIGESTTSFTLPTGTFAMGLDVTATTGNGNAAPAFTPPPEIHTIVKGEIVNLQVIEIGVHPLAQPQPPVPLPPPM
jgi:hypothetical protein